MNEVQQQAWNVVAALNKAWTTGVRADDLRKFFHPDVIALVSADKRKLRGVDACSKHWNECFLNKDITLWEERDQEVVLYCDGKFAVVSYEFKIQFEREGKEYQATSRDLFSLVYENNNWLIVAATV